MLAERLDVGGRNGQHERARRVGQRVEVRARHVGDVGLGAHRADRHACVRGRAGTDRYARDDVEGHDRLGNGQRLLGRPVVGEYVTADEADDVHAVTRFGKHCLGDVGG